jgi:hypothetical protein
MSAFLDPSIARAMGEFDRYALELAAYIGAHPHPNPLRYRIFNLTQVEDDELLDALTTKVRQLLELRENSNREIGSDLGKLRAGAPSPEDGRQ